MHVNTHQSRVNPETNSMPSMLSMHFIRDVLRWNQVVLLFGLSFLVFVCVHLLGSMAGLDFAMLYQKIVSTSVVSNARENI